MKNGGLIPSHVSIDNQKTGSLESLFFD